MKSERGITLTALVAYITVFIIILSIMSIISSYFYKNVGEIKESPKYITEFNKFSMFFITDVKRNSDIVSITSNSIEFPNGNKYIYADNVIYRNDVVIAENVKSLTFTGSNYTVDNFTKKIINVNTTLGGKQETITRNIDFVLKYW